VESPVNSFALLSVLRAGESKVRKVRQYVSLGDRSKNWGQVKKKGCEQIKKMFWEELKFAQTSREDRPKNEDMGTGPIFQVSRSKNWGQILGLVLGQIGQI
jgi:hypothetical protein